MTVVRLFETAARTERVGITVTRIGLIIVLLWIGGLKVFKYEAEGIIPFVANSPFMSFFLADPENYQSHKNPEGALVPENRGMARAEPHVLVRLRSGQRDRLIRIDAMHEPLATSSRGCGQFSSLHYVDSHTVVFDYNAGMLGTAARRRAARISLSQRCRTTCR